MNHPRRSIFRALPFSFLLALLLAGCSSGPGKSPLGAVNAFFALLKADKYQQAYDDAAFGFQAQMSKVAFEAVCRDLSLGSYVSCTWEEGKPSNDREARLNGSFINPAGEHYILVTTLVHERGAWKVFSVKTPTKESGRLLDIFTRINQTPSSFNEAFTRKVPSDAELADLVKDSMKQFNDGIHKKNFKAFFAGTSQRWQSQTSQGEVDKAFQSFIDSGITLDATQQLPPVFTEKRLNSEGALALQGYYPSKPNQIIFDLKYVYELPKWKLLAVTVSVRAPDGSTPQNVQPGAK